MWLDCRSLADHLNAEAPARVQDKRLQIELSALRQSIFSEDGNRTVEAWISSLAQKQNEENESILECMNLVCDLFGEIPSQMHESLVTPRPWPLWGPSLKPTLQCESRATP